MLGIPWFRKGLDDGNIRREERAVQAPAPNGVAIGIEIRQRTPSRRSRRSRASPSSQTGSVFGEGRVASPEDDMRALFPRTPTQGDRYVRERTPPDPIEGSRVTFRRGPRPLQKVNNLPDDWVEDVHPEGQLLYSKIISSRGFKIRVHTDLALRDAMNHTIISEGVMHLLYLLDSSTELQDGGFTESEIEACIIVSEEYPDEYGYYLVNHQDQTIFWLEEVEARDVDMWAYDEDIYRHKLAEQYWRHVTDFPHHCSLSPKVWDELGPLMLLGAVDQEYCEDSTAPKDAQTLARLQGFWSQAKEQRDVDCNRAACNWICARLWYDFVTPRIHNFWGTDYARLERTIIVGEDPRPTQSDNTPWIIRVICAVFLWGEPAVTMKLLEDAWPGGIIYPKPWREMMDMFANEWEKMLVLNAVIFAGAMAFLAIPIQALQGGGSTASEVSSSLIASFAISCGIACCAFSVSSMIAASNLKRDFGGKIATDVHEAGSYLRSLYSDSLGYLKWGICLSLPRVLFQWAVVSFCAGLVILAYQLHQTRVWFFGAEIFVSIILAGGVVAGRYLSPDRITPEPFLKRTLSSAKRTASNAKTRAGTFISTFLSKVKIRHKDPKPTGSLRSNKSNWPRPSSAHPVREGLRSGSSRNSLPPQSTNNNMLGLEFPNIPQPARVRTPSMNGSICR